MGRICILNVNGHGSLLAEYLKTKSEINAIEHKGDRVCIDFNGEITITFEDWIEVYPRKENLTKYPSLREKAREWFKQEVQTPIIKTIKGGEVVEYIPGVRITVKSTEKTEIICIRVTPEEKQKLEEEAEKHGLTLSDYVRAKISISP